MVSVYSPGIAPVIVKSPLVSVVATAPPGCNSTRARWTTAPEESVTCPITTAWLSCPLAPMAKEKHTTDVESSANTPLLVIGLSPHLEGSNLVLGSDVRQQKSRDR